MGGSIGGSMAGQWWIDRQVYGGSVHGWIGQRRSMMGQWVYRSAGGWWVSGWIDLRVTVGSLEGSIGGSIVGLWVDLMAG